MKYMIDHPEWESFKKDLDHKEARIKALKTWLCYLAITFGAVMMLMGATILTYLKELLEVISDASASNKGE